MVAFFRTRLGRFAVAAALSGISLTAWGQAASHGPAFVTVPMRVVNNRVFIPVTVTGPTGRRRTVSFWVDTGGGTIMLSGHVSHDLKLAPTGRTVDGVGESLAQIVSPATLSIAGMQLDRNGMEMAAHLEPASRTVFPGMNADGFLPAGVLKQYDVVFDYPRHTFTLGKPGSLRHLGVAVPIRVQAKSGFARVELAVDGVVHGFMLDTGASYSGMSEALLSRLSLAHPQWPRQVGAVGAANMVGKQFDVENRMLLVPHATLGPFQLQDVGFVSRPDGVYETYVSKEMAAPIVGVLAGNVLRQFRVEMDYANQIAYFEQSGSVAVTSLNCVGIVVRVHEDGAVEISGTALRHGVSEVPGVEAGDRLLAVDGHAVTGSSLAHVLHLLSGKLGETRTLTVWRSGRVLSLPAHVLTHPE